MFRMSDVSRCLFRRFTKKAATVPSNRARLNLTTLEDRTTPTAEVSITATAPNVGEGSSGSFQVTRSDTTGHLSVNFSLSGTATFGSDYNSNSSPVLFGTNDSISEPTESVIATITSGTGYTVGTPDSATINILDNDAQVVMVERVNDGVEDGTDGRFRFTRTGSLSGSLMVNYTVGGTATSGTDYTALGGAVTFAANAATADVTVNAPRDGVDDPDETVTVTVMSGTGYSVGSPSSAEFIIIDADLLPAAFDGWVTTSVNEPVVVGVLDLATDLNGDPLTLIGVTQGADGSVINVSGTVTYTPDTGFVGEDSFTYTVEDQFGNESTGTITVRVTAPIAPPTSVWTAVNTAVTIGVLDMAFDPDGDELEVAAVTQGTNGSVVVNLDGTVTYTPNTSFEGTDTFTYTIEDEDENPATGTLTVTVGAAAADVVVGIVDTLDDITNDITDYTSTTAEAIATAFAAVAEDIADYDDEVSSFISVTDIRGHGANLDIKDFLKQEIAVYREVQNRQANLKAIRDSLHELLLANKARIEALAQQLKTLQAAPNPDRIQIALVEAAALKLFDLHDAGVALIGKVELLEAKVYDEMRATYKATAQGLGFSPNAAQLFLGPEPPFRLPLGAPLGTYIPRIP